MDRFTMRKIIIPYVNNFFFVFCFFQTSFSYALGQQEIIRENKREASVVSSQNENCKSNSIVTSKLLINFILNDLVAKYPDSGGGGITSIKEVLTNTYEVSIAQEGREDILRYELAIDEVCGVKLLKKTESTINYGH
ncbi:hypothetical protein ACJJIF_02785 [Microbulbifer sp. SSSA002]|uniref:hypothetical protein n=1 Tax=Microbulbifer sp. SSSA002 TaxID=3243376 RepID=UPI00403A4240